MPALVNNPLLARPTRPLPQRVGIVGAGSIGPDIGYYLKSALPDLELILVDVALEPIDAALRRFEGYAAKGVAKRKMSEDKARQVLENIRGTLDYGDLAGCDWVIESATEDLPLKRKIFEAIEAAVGPEPVITSNTSSLPAERLFSHLAHPERTTVTHFFAPAWRNPAVEVIRWDRGDEAVVEWLRWLFCSTGKVPLLTEDVLCFALDRVFDNWCNEAGYLLEHATAAEVDSEAADIARAGPFFVLNLARGNPIIWETNSLQMEEGAHYQPALIFRSVKDWETVRPGRRVEVAPETAVRVRDRLLGVLDSQCFDIVDRGIATPADVELGCTLALGFIQGPFDLQAERGADEVRRVAARFQAERPGMPGPIRPVEDYQDFARHVLTDRLDDVVVLTIRRPQALNALDDRVTDELLEAIRAHEADPAVTGFVLVGYGARAFSAGADIGRFPEVLGDFEAAAAYARECSRLLVHLDAMDKPVVAALNGMALGGGLELALRCHEIVALGSAWLQFPEITLGIAPGIGGMVVPYRRWPRAAEVFHGMLRQARKLGAAEAAGLGIIAALANDYAGLVDLAAARVRALGAPERIPAGRVLLPPPPEAEARAGRQPLSPEVFGLIGQAICDAAAAPSLEEALEVGYRAFAATACTAAAAEGIAAFQAGRRPDFTTTG